MLGLCVGTVAIALDIVLPFLVQTVELYCDSGSSLRPAVTESAPAPLVLSRFLPYIFYRELGPDANARLVCVRRCMCMKVSGWAVRVNRLIVRTAHCRSRDVMLGACLLQSG